jgi:hypothetical protein
MIIMKIKAGLGNQMFQYATGRALALRNNDTLKLDLTDWILQKETYRQYELSNFNIVENVASNDEITAIKYNYGKLVTKVISKIKRMMQIDHISFEPAIAKKKGNVYLDGYWQSEKYFLDFADQIREDFTLRKSITEDTTRLQKTIQADDMSISLHIRRGDNAHNPSSMKTFGCPGIDYYQAAIQTLIEKLQGNKNDLSKFNLYVFSDEIDWVKDNLHTSIPMTFVSGSNITACEEIMLMSTCRHNVISNSTFSWWGAWLNPNKDKVVVAPKQWALIKLHNYKDTIPEDWIRV